MGTTFFITSGRSPEILHGMMQVSGGWTVMTDYTSIDTDSPRANLHYPDFQCIEYLIKL